MIGHIPSDASNDMQQALREIWDAITLLTDGNIDLKLARSIVNSLPAVGPDDVVVLRQLTDAVGGISTAPAAAGASVGEEFGSDVHTDYSEYVEQSAAPDTPATNRVRLFALDHNGRSKLFTRDESGVTRTLGPVVRRVVNTFSRLNTTTLLEVTELTIPALANEIWAITWYLVGASTAAADLRLQVDGPTGATGNFGVTTAGGTVTGGDMSAIGSIVQANTPTADYAAVVNAVVSLSSTAGDIKISFAQLTATGGVTTTVLAGSYVTAHRVA